MTASIIASGLQDFIDYTRALPGLVAEAAYFAVNDTARAAVPQISKEMRRQVAFPKGYLNKDRLGLRKKATRVNLEAKISGRDRPTSLARFAEGATPENSRKQPLILQVKPGKKIVLNRPSAKTKAFIVRLNNGNLGLAVRLAKGDVLKNSDKAKRLDNNVYLLYGPSVDQVMQGVAGDETADILELLDRNFNRQFQRIARG